MKILHTADIHFGSNAYGRIDASTGLNSRLLDFKRSFDFLVQRALDEDIDAFLFAGDAYRTADPTPTQQKAFAECLKPIAEKGIPIIMIVGNHDHPISYGKASALDIYPYLSGDVHLFHRPDYKIIETKSGPLQFVALPWPIRSMLLTKEEHRTKSPTEIREFIEEKYIEFVRLTTKELNPALPTIMAAHLSVHGAELSGSELTSLIAHEPKFSVGQLAMDPIDYIALGHIHKFQDRNEGNKPPVVYSGSIECISFKEWEYPKGFVIVEIEGAEIDGAGVNNGRDKKTTFRFIETPSRPFVAIQVDARTVEDPMALILETISQNDIKDAVVRIRYQIEEAAASSIDGQQIREALKEASNIASIERIVTPEERQRRTVVTRESTLEEAMDRYISQHENLTFLKTELIEKALELESAYELQRQGHS
ncbi:MAG: exonuclease SbcCD subunit D [Rhodothermales bacterium]